jgi:hypothetical protein
MSTTGKNLSYIKRKFAQELRPNVISQTITFKHEATSFVTTIDLSNLNTPASASANGFVNPSSSVLPFLITFRQNVSVESTYKGKLIDYQDYIIVNATQIELLNGLTTEPGEIFTIRLVIPNDVDTKSILDILSDPSTLINKYRYNVDSVKNYSDPDLSGQILTILQYVSQKNRSKNPVLGQNESIGVFTTSLTSGGIDHAGAVLLPDGRVFVVPRYSTNAKIYNPFDNSVISISFTVSGQTFFGGVLLKDGRIFCFPEYAPNAKIYNPLNNNISNITAITNGYVGGVLLKDGRVFCVPRDATVARIYNPITNSATPVNNALGNGYSGAVLLPNGQIFCVPSDASNAKIYDPITDSVTPVNSTLGNGYSSGVLLPDGRVFVIPSSASNAKIYDPITDSVTTITGITGGSDAYFGGILLPDGRIFLVPTNATTAKIYDPISNYTLNVPNLTGGGGAYEGGILLKDGRVFLVPYAASNARIVSGSWCQPMNEFQLPPEVVLSPYLNKF